MSRPTPAGAKGVSGSVLASDTFGAQQSVTAPFGHALVRAGERDRRVVGLTADLGKYTDMHVFGARFPDRYFQIGMAEQNLIGVAAGLSRSGFVPFATTYAVFATRRAYDFISMGVAFGRANVKIVAGLPGITTGYGGTHQGIEDLALMRAMPNMVVIDPCDATEIEQVVSAIATYEGPVYMRLLRGEVARVLDPASYSFEIGRNRLLRTGGDVGIVGLGLMTQRALDAAELLSSQGIGTQVLHVSTLKPFDADSLLELASSVKHLVTAENHVINGALASAVAETLVQARVSVPLTRIGLPDSYCDSGSIPYLFRRYRLDAESIAETIQVALGEQSNKA